MDGGRRSDGWLLALVFALTAAALVGRTIGQAGHIPLIADTDDAMRLVVVRDFIAGQNWFDHMQYRLDAPFGALIHWSRLVDLPIATIMLVLRPILGVSASETAAAFVYPLSLLLVLMWLNLRLVLRLVGPAGRLPALVLPAFSLVTVEEFSPGRFDHHSMQILLLLAALLFALGSLERPRFAIGSAIAAATALAIGVESLPTVVAAVGAFALVWVVDSRRAATMRLFGLALSDAMAAHLAIALPPDRWFVPACDEISIVYVTAGIGAGLMLALLSVLPLGTARWYIRLGVGALGGGLVIAAVLALFPGCLRGPYANLDPWLIANWIDQVQEAKPFWSALLDDPGYTLAIAAPALLATAVATWQALRGPADRRLAWLVYLVFIGFSVVVMLVQIRASRMATALAAPAGAFVIALARERYLEHRRLRSAAALVGGWVGFAGFAWALVVTVAVGLIPGYQQGLDDPDVQASLDCRMPSAYSGLAQLTPTRVMSLVDLGSHILAFTPHSVVGAPYHRDVDGLHDTFDFFNGPIDKARAILERRGVQLVVICPGMPELGGVGEVAPDSFNRLYAAGNLPAWLVDRSGPDSPLKIYAVAPGS